MGMSMNARVAIAVFVFFFSAAALAGQDRITVAMTHPLLFQIKNAEMLYQKDLIPLKSFTLLAVYHEDEFENEEEAEEYEAAFDYVRQNKLTWVQFRKITGRVEARDLFRENLWTPQFKEIFAVASGIIFTGGMDIPPALYGEAVNLLSDPTTPSRALYEISFLFHLVGGTRNRTFIPWLEQRRNFPLLAICHGVQGLNVAAGGTLVQDIPTQVYGLAEAEAVLARGPDQVHSDAYLEKLFPNDDDLTPALHRIRLLKESLFVRRLGMKAEDRPFVASNHHQAIAALGADLWTSATSMDGKIVEAVEHRRYPNVLGVQFHPERHTLYKKGIFMRPRTGAPLDFNPLSFLAENPPSLDFHRRLWAWFASQL